MTYFPCLASRPRDRMTSCRGERSHMKIRRITTAEAPLGAATQTGELSGTSRVTAGTGSFR